MIDLFCGTSSVSRVFKERGWDTLTLDIDPKCGADITVDILELRREQLPPAQDVRFVWASPPCVQYSIARTTAKTPRNFPEADRIVAKAFEINGTLT